jgi:hypothetical protein
MSHHTPSNVPLLGTLCVVAGLISQDDLDFCLALQRQMDDGTPIGEILLLHNYLSARDLAWITLQQQVLRGRAVGQRPASLDLA